MNSSTVPSRLSVLVQIEVKPMAISNELSTDIATALFSSKEHTPEELAKLKRILLEVHSTLQAMSERAREARSAKVRPIAKAATND